MYRVSTLYKVHGKELGLELIAGKGGLSHPIKVPEAHRPGLSLAGYLKNNVSNRLVVLGKAEISFLHDLSAKTRKERLSAIITNQTPSVIVTRGNPPLPELKAICEERMIPLFGTPMQTMTFLAKLTLLLSDEFALSHTCHGTLVEVFGVGVLIQGESAVGKSEAALGLVERGHRLVSDDLVRVKKREGYLEGSGVQLSKYHMEVRGIGIINVANLYGAVCVRDKKSLDLVVNLEVWDDGHFYDRVGLVEKTTEILGVAIPYHVLPVKPGRDVVLLLETIALNHRLKEMGYHSAKEFNAKLLKALSQKRGGRKHGEAGQKSTRKK